MEPQKDQHSDVSRIALRTPAGFLAFGFGSGLVPVAPGTAGTVAALPFAIALKLLPMPLFWPALGLAFLLGIYLCEVTARQLGREDPGGIVWDEMVGFWLTVALLPLQWHWFLAAFVLFRVFDILKPWPVRWLERRFHGGLGIMLDDVMAALYAMAVLELARRLI